MACSSCGPVKKGKVYKIDIPVITLSPEKFKLFKEATEYWWDFISRNSQGNCTKQELSKIVWYINTLFNTNYPDNSLTALQHLRLISAKYRNGEYKPIIQEEKIDIKEEKIAPDLQINIVDNNIFPIVTSESKEFNISDVTIIEDSPAISDLPSNTTDNKTPKNKKCKNCKKDEKNNI